MLEQATFADILSATSSPESADGRRRCGSPDGQATAPSGPAPAHASRSAPLEKIEENKMSDTYGQFSSSLSDSVDLRLYWENRLALQSNTAGSMIYAMTWKEKVTPRGRRYYQLAVSAHRTKETGFTGWQTPTAQMVQNRSELSMDARVKKRLDTGRKSLSPGCLAEQVNLYCGWATPTVTDASRGVQPPRPHDTGIPLTQQIGLISNGYNVETTSKDRLNPALCRWLMGYQQEWCKDEILAYRRMRQAKQER